PQSVPGGHSAARHGDPAGSLAALAEQRNLAGALEAESPTDAVRTELAQSHHGFGSLLRETGKPAEALTAFRKARDIQQLADAHPAVTQFQSDLTTCHNLLGRPQARLQRFPEAFAALDKGLALRQKLADAPPPTPLYTTHLGYSHAYRGVANVRTGHPAATAAHLRRSLGLWDKDKAPLTDT